MSSGHGDVLSFPRLTDLPTHIPTHPPHHCCCVCLIPLPLHCTAQLLQVSSSLAKTVLIMPNKTSHTVLNSALIRHALPWHCACHSSTRHCPLHASRSPALHCTPNSGKLVPVQLWRPTCSSLVAAVHAAWLHPHARPHTILLLHLPCPALPLPALPDPIASTWNRFTCDAIMKHSGCSSALLLVCPPPPAAFPDHTAMHMLSLVHRLG
jgi:hypothetical protein